MAEDSTSPEANDAEETARVAALVARAGVRLPADQIAGLVSAYRADRAGFERLRGMLRAEDDETAHSLRATGPGDTAS
jgi:hypothetical protein